MGRGTFEHVFANLEPATAYSIRLQAYSAEGASQDSASIHASTMGSSESQPLRPCRAPGSGQTGCQPARPVSSTAPAVLGFSTTVLNATSVQASWQLPAQPGPIQGFKLFHRKLPAAHFEGSLLLASSVSSFLYTDLGEALNWLCALLSQEALFFSQKALFPSHSPAPAEPAALYEIKLQAFNGNGDGDSSARFVSLCDVPLATAGEWLLAFREEEGLGFAPIRVL